MMAEVNLRRIGGRWGGALPLVLAAWTGSTSAAQAQTPPNLLPPTREEVTRKEPAPTPLNRAVRVDVEGGLERAPCALDAREFQDVRFTLRGVEFSGVEAFTAGGLDGSYRDLVGTQQPISAVCQIRDRAAAILADAGYIAAVQVPEQRVSDGIVRFDVVMARLTQVRVRGDAGGAERVIAGYLNRLTRQPIFNRFEAERYLLLASDLPGYTVRLTLRPAGTAPGDVIGDVTVQRTPAYADLYTQNGGSRELGRWGGLLRGEVYGLTGLADRTSIGVFTTADFDEQRTLQLGHDMRVGAGGLGAGGLFTYAWAHPTVPGNGDVRARSLVTTLYLDYPVVRSVARTVRVTGGFDLVNQDVDFNNDLISRDRLRVMFARVTADAVSTGFSSGRSSAEPLWRVSGLLEVRKGLDLLGASDRCGTAGDPCDGVPTSRSGGLPTAALVRALLDAEARPLEKLTFALRARAQYASKPLLGFEQFAAGNYTVGRGYDPGALLGDRGWGTQAEMRFGSTIPETSHSVAAEGYVFWDHLRLDDVGGGLVFGSNHLDSAGGGVRVAYGRFLLDAGIAIPLTRIGLLNRKPDPRFLISLTTRLWPWSYD